MIGPLRFCSIRPSLRTRFSTQPLIHGMGVCMWRLMLNFSQVGLPHPGFIWARGRYHFSLFEASGSPAWRQLGSHQPSACRTALGDSDSELGLLDLPWQLASAIGSLCTSMMWRHLHSLFRSTDTSMLVCPKRKRCNSLVRLSRKVWSVSMGMSFGLLMAHP